MICIKTEHFHLSRILLLIVGLWPYYQTKLTRFQLIVLFGIMITFFGSQCLALITIEYEPKLVIKALASTLFFVGFIIKYASLWINVHTVKLAIEHLQRICNELRDANEIAIIRKYGSKANFYTSKLIVLSFVGSLGFLAMPIWPLILETFLSINISRPRIDLYVVTEFFVDQEEYFYTILVYMDLATCIGAVSSIAAGTTYLAYIEHACGMFTIASYRMEQAITIDTLQNSSLENEIQIHRKLIFAIDMHRKAINFCEFLVTAFEKPYFLLIIMAVSCLSLNLYQIVTTGDDVTGIHIHLANSGIIFGYIFVANYIGQEVTEHDSRVYLTAYNIQWYIAPLSIRKMILFLLQKSKKEYQLTIYGLFSASMELFASLTSTSVSYFTVMYSTQQ